MSTETVLHRDAPLCRERFAALVGFAQQARAKAKRLGWVEARINRRIADYCPAHSNYRTKQ